MLIPVISKYCEDQAQRHGQLERVKRLAEKILKEQIISNWENFPDPILKKKLEGYRLIAEKRKIASLPEVVFVCFYDVFARGEREYEEFRENPRDYIQRQYVNHRNPDTSDEALQKYYQQNYTQLPTELPRPNQHERKYLDLRYVPDTDTSLIYESFDWVKEIKGDHNLNLMTRYYDLINDKILKHDKTGERVKVECDKSDAAIWFYKANPGCIFLLSPSQKNEELSPDLEKRYPALLSGTDPVTEDHIRRLSGRVYPAYVLADQHVWENIQKNEAGNLALSPEETALLQSILQGNTEERYPLFINGRPGSGKSTMLQYIFAEYLRQHISIMSESGLALKPPIYLTYSRKLLDAAKSTTESILKYSVKHSVERSIVTDTPEFKTTIENSFHEFHQFLIDLLPQEIRARFDKDKRIRYAEFKRLWLAQRQKDPDNDLRRLSPELAWHVIRTYIKGRQDEDGDYFDADAYEDLPSKQRTVQSETYRLIYKSVWPWYQNICEEEGWWDDQDLTWEVLRLSQKQEAPLDIAQYPAIFCDEAQDFTRNELELILHLSLFSKRTIEQHELKNVPFVFAGDPYQTLNPTGFDWNIVQAQFHETLIQGLDRLSSSRLKFNFQELSYNYRSTDHVVGFCNLLQLMRGILFRVRGLQPQEVWFKDPNAASVVYFSADDIEYREKLREQNETIIILPCQEGEEREYAESDDFLSELGSERGSINELNVFSPASIKGLEFSRVVLYKFGASYLEDYPQLLEPIERNSPPHTGENALPLQYFINRLYVAASRPRKRLIIVDSEEAIEKFWKHKNLVRPENLISLYQSETWKSETWKSDHLSSAIQGSITSWTEDRDDPKKLAEDFERTGQEEKDPYKMSVAARHYRSIGNKDRAVLCEALAHEYEKNYSQAGEKYLEVNRHEEALRCFWKADKYGDIAAKVKSSSPEVDAAHFMLSRKSQSDSITFLDKLSQSHDLRSIEVDGRWQKVGKELFETLVRLQFDRTQSKDVHKKAQTVANAFGLSKTPELAELAFRAEEYKSAVDIWESPNTDVRRENYNYAKSQITPYPDKLDYMRDPSRNSAVIEVWLNNRNVMLSKSQQEIVFKALVKTERKEKYSDIIRLLQGPQNGRLVSEFISTLHEENQFERLNHQEIYNLVRAAQQIEDYENFDQLRSNFIRLIESAVQSPYQVSAEDIDVLNQLAKRVKYENFRNKPEVIRKLGELLGRANKWKDAIEIAQNPDFTKENADELHKTLISQASQVDISGLERSEKRKLEEYLAEVIRDESTLSLVPPAVAGAAIERIGRIKDALTFYGQMMKREDSTENERLFARQRWIKSKLRLADYIRSRDRNSGEAEKHRNEALRRAREWNISVKDIPEYPVIGASERVAETDYPVDQDKIDLILERHALGWSMDRIARLVSLPTQTVEDILRQKGLLE